MKKILIPLLLILAACAQVPEPVGCTEDAKLCLDGTTVVRVAPDCEFEQCPEPEEQVFCTADVKECPDGSYVSRVPPECNFEPCPELTVVVEPAPEPQKTIVGELLREAYELGHAFEIKDGTMYVYKDQARFAYVNLMPVQGLKYEGKLVYFTDVYFDRHKKTATGLCDLETEISIVSNYEASKSKCKDFINVTFDLNFQEYYSLTPLDWLEKYQYTEPTTIVKAEQTIKIQTGYKTIQPVLIFERGEDRTTLHIDKKQQAAVAC